MDKRTASMIGIFWYWRAKEIRSKLSEAFLLVTQLGTPLWNKIWQRRIFAKLPVAAIFAIFVASSMQYLQYLYPLPCGICNIFSIFMCAGSQRICVRQTTRSRSRLTVALTSVLKQKQHCALSLLPPSGDLYVLRIAHLAPRLQPVCQCIWRSLAKAM